MLSTTRLAQLTSRVARSQSPKVLTWPRVGPPHIYGCLTDRYSALDIDKNTRPQAWTLTLGPLPFWPVTTPRTPPLLARDHPSSPSPSGP